MSALFLALLALPWTLRRVTMVSPSTGETVDDSCRREVYAGDVHLATLVVSHADRCWLWGYPHSQGLAPLWSRDPRRSWSQETPEALWDEVVARISDDLRANAESDCWPYLMGMITGERGPL